MWFSERQIDGNILWGLLAFNEVYFNSMKGI